MSTNTAAVLAFVALLALLTGWRQEERIGPDPADHECTIDLARVEHMEDVLSNALMLGRGFEESLVTEYLARTRPSCADGQELLAKAAGEFGLDPVALTAEVERYRHVNCDVASEFVDADAQPLTRFAQDVTLHVVLHELGHALIREFDLPVLGNEETMADAFATHFLTMHLPERAFDVLRARVASFEYEAGEVPRAEWSVTGEHDNDARRARQIAALAVAADPSKYRAIAELVGLTDDDIQSAADYGAEIHRSWRRILRPLWMPEGLASLEAEVECEGEGRTLDEVRASGLLQELEAIVQRFDWHSRVEIRFVAGDGGASWSRSERAVTVHSAYVQRFVGQGEKVAGAR